jgi:hypothetical protein
MLCYPSILEKKKNIHAKMKFLAILFLLLILSIYGVKVKVEEEEEKPKEVKKAPKKPVDWNKIDERKLDKEWEEGDEEDELEDEYEKIRKLQAEKQPKIDMSDPDAIRNAVKQDPFSYSGGGGTMVFVDLFKKQPNGKPWNKPAMEALARKFSTLLKSGGIPSYVYNIEEDRLLVHCEKPWQVKDMMTFLARQSEVREMTASSKVYKPKEWLKTYGKGSSDDDDDDDDDEL